MKEIIIAIIIIAFTLAGLIFIPLLKILKLKDKLESFKKDVDYAFNRRWLIIPKYIEEVKAHAKKNRENLERMILLRNTTYENMSFIKKAETDKEFVRIIDEVALEYECSNELKEELASIEERVFHNKENYVAILREIDQKIQKFPYNFVGFLINFKKEYYDI